MSQAPTQSVLQPPSLVQGMTTLDKSKFDKEVCIPVLKVRVCMMHSIMSVLSPYLLKMEKMKPIQAADSDDQKIINLNPDLVKNFDSFARNVKTCLEEMNITLENLELRSVLLTYDNWKSHEIIAAILPPPFNFSGFSIIGSIIHVNLREEIMPFKNVIGDVLRDKFPHCKSVVNKVGQIENVYRNLKVEILSGSDDLQTETKENGCLFKMDFEKVYWNPRLHEEHCRIINLVSRGDVLYDVFCGIGPFAIPIAKKGCYVLANDLNPSCYHWLQHNLRVNKVSDRVAPSNKNAEDFIMNDFREDYLRRISHQSHKNSIFHITMNLPCSSHMFLRYFVNLFSPEELANVEERLLPVVYLYCFLKNETDRVVEVRQLIRQGLPASVADGIEDRDIFHVRNVAPRKEMYRVTFSLSKEVLTGAFAGQYESDDGYPCAKKIRLNSENERLKRANSVEECIHKKFKSD